MRRYPAFPIVLETYRQALRDRFDLPGLRDVLRGVRSRAIRVHEVETRRASPFARSLVFAYVAAHIYEQDAPLAERRAQALTLDRELLAELLGQAELRELIDPEVLAALEAELQHLEPGRRARDATSSTTCSAGSGISPRPRPRRAQRPWRGPGLGASPSNAGRCGCAWPASPGGSPPRTRGCIGMPSGWCPRPACRSPSSPRQRRL